MSDMASPVAFHTGVVNPVEHALRLVRKALGLGSRVLVIGPQRLIAPLDEQLWVAEPGSFMAHIRWTVEAATASRARLAPVWLMAPASTDGAALGHEAPARDVLINLGISGPTDPSRYPKVIEVVGSDPDSKSLGQARWRAWRAQGVQPVHHAFS